MLLSSNCQAKDLVESYESGLRQGSDLVTKGQADLRDAKTLEAKLASQKELNQGWQLIDQASRSNPTDSGWQTKVAQRVSELGEPNRALPYADKAVQLAPDDPNARATRASIKYQAGDYAGAKADANAALSIDPHNASAIATIKSIGDRAGAAQAPRQTGVPRSQDAAPASAGSGKSDADLLPFFTGEHARSASIVKQVQNQLEAHNYPDAIALAARAMQVDPGNPLPFFQSALAKLHLHNFHGAAADAESAIRAGLPARYAFLARNLQGRAYLAVGKYENAKAAADAALKLNPKSGGAYLVRALAAESLHEDPSRFLADLRSAKQYMQPDEADDIMKEYKRAMQAYSAAAGRLAPAPFPADSFQDRPQIVHPANGERPPRPDAPRDNHALASAILLALAALGGLVALKTLWRVAFPPALVTAGAAPGGSALSVRTAGPQPSAPAAPPSASNGHAAEPLHVDHSTIEIGRMIGQGGMGNVYEGEDRSLGRKVAIKELRGELQGDPRARERFLNEARLVARLSHPNIVAIHSVINTARRTLLVFEYVDGRTLAEILHDSPRHRLEPRQALDVARQVCSALEFAHGKHVIHRDLKPSNIMVEESGRVKVMDFGIARQAKDSMMAMTNTVMGTPYYMAPEMERGEVGKEGDLYSFAVCLYEMATGDVPFEGPGCMRLKHEGTFLAPSKRDPSLSPKLDAFFAKALNPNPAKRPKDAVELMNEFFAAALT